MCHLTLSRSRDTRNNERSFIYIFIVYILVFFLLIRSVTLSKFVVQSDKCFFLHRR